MEVRAVLARRRRGFLSRGQLSACRRPMSVVVSAAVACSMRSRWGATAGTLLACSASGGVGWPSMLLTSGVGCATSAISGSATKM